MFCSAVCRAKCHHCQQPGFGGLGVDERTAERRALVQVHILHVAQLVYVSSFNSLFISLDRIVVGIIIIFIIISEEVLEVMTKQLC
jgi:hypothetical protein